jgi:hypothetical protein
LRGRTCSLRLQGQPAKRYAIEAAPNLSTSWTRLRTNITDAVTGQFDFSDTNAVPPGRFYRARLMP